MMGSEWISSSTRNNPRRHEMRFIQDYPQMKTGDSCELVETVEMIARMAFIFIFILQDHVWCSIQR